MNKSGKGQYTKGQSGNPSGRPKDTRDRATLIADELFNKALFGSDKKAEAIIAKAVYMAECGDTTCMRLCFERIAPARKDRPVYFELPPMCEAGDAVNASAAIVAAVATGQTPSEEAELSKVVESYTRVLQAADFRNPIGKGRERKSAMTGSMFDRCCSRAAGPSGQVGQQKKKSRVAT